jgi:hypothetical protein
MPPSTLPSDTEKLQNIGMLLGSIYSSYLEAKELRGSCRKGLSSLLMLAAFEIWNTHGFIEVLPLCPPLDYRPLNGMPPLIWETAGARTFE